MRPRKLRFRPWFWSLERVGASRVVGKKPKATSDSSGQPQVVSFAATFVQHSEGATPALYGAILYNSTATIADTSAPTTAAHVSGSQVTLKVTDPDGAADVAQTLYQIDNGPVQTYSGPFTISGSKVHLLRFQSLDPWGNTELVKSMKIAIDMAPPAITLAATVGALQNGQYPVTLSGKITDSLSKVDPASPAYSVQDEYGQDQPAGAVTLNADGTYSFILLLDKANAGDTDGRKYTITLQARDKAGNLRTHSVVVTLPAG